MMTPHHWARRLWLGNEGGSWCGCGFRIHFGSIRQQPEIAAEITCCDFWTCGQLLAPKHVLGCGEHWTTGAGTVSANRLKNR